MARGQQASTDRRSIKAKIADWWLERVWPDLAISALITGVHLALFRWWDWDNVSHAISTIDPEQRLFIYVGLATVAALVAGSNNTAVGSYVSSAGDVMKEIRVKHGAAMRRGLRSNGLWLWAVAVVSLVCIALDPMDAGHPLRTRGAAWIAEAALLLVVTKYARLMLMQDVLLKANDLTRQREVVAEQARTRRQFKKP